MRSIGCLASVAQMRIYDEIAVAQGQSRWSGQNKSASLQEQHFLNPLSFFLSQRTARAQPSPTPFVSSPRFPLLQPTRPRCSFNCTAVSGEAVVLPPSSPYSTALPWVDTDSLSVRATKRRWKLCLTKALLCFFTRRVFS